MTDNQIVPATAAPIASVQAHLERYNKLVELINSGLLVEGTDYGTIPGTSKREKVDGKWIEKPNHSLLKPGAEKLATFFQLHSTQQLVASFEDWIGELSGGVPTFSYTYKCTLWHGSEKIAECVGSCNSKEKKYRYKWEGQGNNRQQVEVEAPFDIINTLHKMAQKRSFVGAVLIAVNASAFFTQDIIEEIEPSQQPEQPKRSWVDEFYTAAIEHIGYPAMEALEDALQRLGYGKKEEGFKPVTKANRYIVLGELQTYADRLRLWSEEQARKAADFARMPVDLEGLEEQQSSQKWHNRRWRSNDIIARDIRGYPARAGIR